MATTVWGGELPGPTVPEGLGVNIHFTTPRAGEMEMLAAAGFRVVRMDFTWAATEQEQGKYDFRAYDRLLEALEPHRIRALWILDYANRFYDAGLSPRSAEGRTAFARWAAAAVRHFRGRGVIWEMYNEPNIQFWKPTPNVDDYVKLALEVGKALRGAAPGETYVGPATSQIDFRFLEACFQAGLLEYWSAVTVHPYRQKAPETALLEYDRLREMIARYAPPGKRIPILAAEWGYSSAWKKFDEVRQGKLLPRELLVNLAAGIPLSIWYDWHDDGPDSREPEHHFGTVRYPYFAGRRPVYDPKPAYRSAQTLARLLTGFQFERRIPVAAADDFVLQFRRGEELRIAAWSTAAPHTARLAGLTGRFQVTDHLGKTLPEVQAQAAGLELSVDDAPLYLVPCNGVR
jgi:hypothetical protein